MTGPHHSVCSLGCRSASTTRNIPPGSVFVLGDCPPSSVDSRSWGPLPVENVRARPFVRVLPFARAGMIDTRDLNPFARAFDRRVAEATLRTVEPLNPLLKAGERRGSALAPD